MRPARISSTMSCTREIGAMAEPGRGAFIGGFRRWSVASGARSAPREGRARQPIQRTCAGAADNGLAEHSRRRRPGKPGILREARRGGYGGLLRLAPFQFHVGHRIGHARQDAARLQLFGAQARPFDGVAHFAGN